MAVSIYPTAYSPVKEPVIFQIDDSGVVEVEINGYYKQLPTSNRSVNVAPYYRGEFSFEPLSNSIIESSASIGRIASANIKIDGESSESVLFTYGDTMPTADLFMSDLKRRYVTNGGIDEVMVLTNNATRIVITSGSQISTIVLPTTQMSAVAIVPSDYGSSNNVVAHLCDGLGNVLDTIYYTIIEQEGINIAWINAYGAVDRAVLFRNTSELSVEKDSIYLNSGYCSVDIVAEEKITAYSKPLRESDMRAMCYVLNSDVAWMQQDGMWIGIDVTSTSGYIYQDTELSPLEVAFRTKMR